MNPPSILDLLRDMRLFTGFATQQAIVESFFLGNDLETVAAAVVILSGSTPAKVFAKKELHRVILGKSNLPEWLLKACKDHTANLSEAISLIGGGSINDQTHCCEALSAWFVACCDDNLSSLERVPSKDALLHAILSVGCPVTRQNLLSMLCGGALQNPPLKVLRAGLQSVFEITPIQFAWMLREPGARNGNWLSRGSANRSDPKDSFSFSQLTSIPSLESIPWPQADAWAEPCCRGCHCQLHIGCRGVMLWSKDDEDLTSAFPEIAAAAACWNNHDLVFEGVVTPAPENTLGPTACLNARRQSSNPNYQSASNPVVFQVFDLLHCDSEDVQSLPLRQRRLRLQQLLASTHASRIHLLPGGYAREHSSSLGNATKAGYPHQRGWVFKNLESIHERGYSFSSGLVLRSPPPEILASLTSIRLAASMLTSSAIASCTFSLQGRDGWLPIAHIDNSLSESLRETIDALVTARFKHTLTLTPSLIARISYQEILPNPRTKAGCSLHNATIVEWIPNGHPDHADSIEALLIPQTTTSPSVTTPAKSPQLLLFDD